MEVFNLFAKLSLDTSEYEKGLKNAGEAAKGIGGKVKKALDIVTKASAAAISTGAAAAGKIVKDSVAAYGDYEQLVGGAQKIFDKIDYSKIAEDADNAYKDLNMSASEYLESINLAGATFAQTMGDEKGYNTARKGMLAISDYASGTGRSITELNTKYQMITRAASSYQSIADQFSGILPATSADFFAQAQAAGYLSKEYEKLTEVPVNEYQQAVTDMLVKGVDDLGLSMNTASESTETLTGSMAMTKAAWQNLVTGFSRSDGDIDKLINNLTVSAEAALTNIIPITERAVKGLSNFVEKALPKFFDKIPKLLDKFAPQLITTSLNVVKQIATSLPKTLPIIVPLIADVFKQLVSLAVELLPEIINAITDIFPILIQTLSELTPILINALPDIIKSVANGIIKIVETLPELSDLVFTIIDTISITMIDLIPILTETALTILEKVIEFNLDPERMAKIVELSLKLIIGLAGGLLAAVPKLLVKIGEIIGKVFTYITETDWTEIGRQLMTNITEALKKAANKLSEWWDGWAQEIGKYAVIAWDSVVETWSNVGQWFADRWEDIKNVFNVVGTWFKDTFTTAWENIKTIFEPVSTFFSGVWDNVKNAFSAVGTWFKDTFNTAWTNIKNVFDNTGVTEFFNKVWSGIKNAFSAVGTWFKDTFNTAWDNVKNVFSPIGDSFRNVSDSVLSGLKSIINSLIDGINQVITIPFDGLNTSLRGIRDMDIFGQKPFSWIGEISVPEIPHLAKGGVLKKGQMAFLEGQGDEAVIPLSQNTEWIKKVADQISENQRQSNYYYNVNIHIDEMGTSKKDIEQFAEQLMEAMSDITARREYITA